ncbi:ABC transporter substrate-binding protein [Brachybacterium fresconis]|uniref:Multiple sugar transport system substrate-binding protein n=1 Tax=Brachybacterium fresconis TaxID=173363 RepID=A0ABS4YK38_9MICO|nr:multiple sugar transport system substrate-binding protein [Brachybacterium fresconis]
MRLTRRGLLSAAGAAGLTSALGACGYSGLGTSEANELSILTPLFEDAAGKEALEGVIGASFQEQHPGLGISVDYTPWDKLNEKLSTAFAGGLVPDVIMSGVGWTPPFAEKGIFGELPESTLDGLAVHERILDSCRYDDRLFALPYQMEGRFFAYRREMLEEHGISETPTTLEDFRAMGKELQGGDAVPIDLFSNNIRQTWIHLMAAYGGKLFSEDGTQVTFDDGTGEAAIEFMIHLIEDGSTEFGLRWAQGQPRPIQQGRVAMELLNNAVWPTVAEQTPELVTEENMGMFLLPAASGGDPVMFQGGTLISISGTTERPDLARAYLAHSLTPTPLIAASRHGGRAPGVTDLPEDEVLSRNRFSEYVLENLDYAGGAEGGSPAWMEIRDQVGPQVEAAVTGAQSPAETIAELKRLSEDALRRI